MQSFLMSRSQTQLSLESMETNYETSLHLFTNNKRFIEKVTYCTDLPAALN